MKKFLPFVFPAAALMIVAILAFRWYSSQTQPVGEVGPATFAEGVQIEDLSTTEQNQVMLGVGDYQTVMLEPNQSSDSAEMMGQVRYELADGKVKFSVMAGLPILSQGQYQVWLKSVDSEALRKAFVLEFSKGGYLGSAAISEDVLPFEVILSQESVDDASIEQVLMRGVIAKSDANSAEETTK